MSAVVARVGPWSARVERRTISASLGLAAVALALAVVGLSYGPTWASPAEVFSALLGRGDSVVVIRDWRLPYVSGALVFGAALGLAGAIFQNLTRNPLGSPDIIGLDAGAYTGALVALTVLSGTAAQLAVGSVLGGLLAAAAIYVLALDKGLSGPRMIIIGIATNAILTALNSWMVLRAELEVAMAAGAWMAGSINGLSWGDVRLPFVIIGLLVVLLAVVAPAVHQAALGDALAATSGVDLARLRLVMIVVGVGCTATVTAVAGPIVFIALAAPQIGRRLTRAAGVPLVPAALTGAVLLLAAALVAQMLLAPITLPVGVVTTAIGGCYLIWLLIKEVRRP